jgi:hypothetical protein
MAEFAMAAGRSLFTVGAQDHNPLMANPNQNLVLGEYSWIIVVRAAAMALRATAPPHLLF